MTLAELREHLFDLLAKWESSPSSTVEVHEAAEELLAQWDWQSHPRNEPASIVNEVLAQLDALNVQRIIPGDIPAIRAFLGASPGAERQAWRTWASYWVAVDHEARARALRGQRAYGLGDESLSGG